MDSTREKGIIDELLRGKDYVIKLQDLLQTGSQTALAKDNLANLDEIAGKISTSFNKALLKLCSYTPNGTDSSGDVFQTSPSDEGGANGPQEARSCADSNKIPTAKERRGCYKRKKPSESRIVFDSKIDDGRTWRKYGQKEIINSTHPRSYFRCSRRYSQGCKATKQVQKMEDDPNMYRIIYISDHTCKEDVEAPSLISGTDPWRICSNLSWAGPLKVEPMEVKERVQAEDETNDDIWANFFPQMCLSSSNGVFCNSGLDMEFLDSEI